MVAPNPEFDVYSQDYRNLVNQSVEFSGLTVDFFTQGKANFFNRKLQGIHNLKILDIGCGIGQIHSLITASDRTITGVDVSGESVRLAESHHPNHAYKVYDGYTLPFEDHTFDVALTICVMHHVPPTQWHHFCVEMTRVVKPGGWVFIFEHNPYNPLTRLAVNRCPFDKDAVLLTARKTETLLTSTGMIQPCSEYLFFTPFQHSVFQKFDRCLKKVPLGAQYCTYGKKNFSKN